VGLVFGAPQPPTGGISAQAKRAIHDAENLSLLKDREPACLVLIRAIKKATDEDSKVLKDKLSQLAKYFYTDKGFQDYLEGKDLFEKQRFSEALEKFNESEELEKGNSDVLHYLELTNLWLKSPSVALAESKKALQINPYDVETIKDELAIWVALENWSEAIKVSQSLSKDFADSSLYTLYGSGRALLSEEDKSEGEKRLELALTKDPALPEPYYFLSLKDDSAESTKLLNKYLELCKAKNRKAFDRVPEACSHLTEAEKLKQTSKSVNK
jgi:tetratricopeptide (TPR) repeat protein